ncbi:bacillithiol biosynthesis deacetylase BshB1 [Priestia taiwanensis]|uniref:Bacillithiol biosynthesis deacetylase BshB1 n=1 Tax=Priestia taiwanensis TaxID=1347902 RepID=A0A917AJH4_9BACI|nr:bacillithiol biosynthesis deacetylase BshB1 [Priestia taiwanensis]MBM7361722.1 bacillithiol biosynthesis deacetylase BshB1 [Priestia taiwanensis]GGE56442.1 bacillithiol biosynthesis deacetylase BshB1 [Priestia taiwanensis]
MTDALDILAFGAHPDDVEIGMAGTIAKYVKTGAKIGICDLTLAELSSNGNVELRKQEAKKAGEVLGLSARANLELPDRGLYMKEEYIAAIVRIIRTYQPKVVFAPYYEDRHPDHANCANLVREALFSAGVRKFLPEYKAHRVQAFHYYMINGFHHTSFIIDITNEVEVKKDALRAYASQFSAGESGVETPLTTGYVDSVIARDKVFGKEVNVTYGEGFITDKPLLVQHDLVGVIT